MIDLEKIKREDRLEKVGWWLVGIGYVALMVLAAYEGCIKC